MLFEAQLKVKEAHYARDWGDAPLDYGGLKRLLRVTPDAPSSQNAFFVLVNKEIQRINKSGCKTKV